jgi:uncharacterized protein involved in outer membrane biogenesis
MKKALRWLLVFLTTLLLSIALLLGVLVFVQIPIELNGFKKPVERFLGDQLGRAVIIKDSVVISTSLNPYFTIKGLYIANPAGFTDGSDFLAMDLARIQIELLPLLKRKVHISEIQVQGINLNLQENVDGQVNWLFAGGPQKKGQPVTKSETIDKKESPDRKFTLAGDSLAIKKLNFQDIRVKIKTAKSKRVRDFKLISCLGSMVPGKPLDLDIKGKFEEFDYTVDVLIASLEDFLRQNRSWMEIRAAIAETTLFFSGDVNLATAARSIGLQTTVEGKNLASLNNLLDLDLPPFAPYKLDTALQLQQNTFKLEKLSINTGSSSLEGAAEIVVQEDISKISLELTSPKIQINDFFFDDWSWSTKNNQIGQYSENTTESTTNTEKEELAKVDKVAADIRNRKLLSPELLAKFDVSLAIAAKEVLSGEDKLGSGALKATLSKGRIEVDPLRLNLPGGEIKMMASLKPGDQQSEAGLKVNINNFDLGILVRRKQPDSDMGGLVNLSVDVTSSAATADELLENGSGYFDFSGHLENIDAGILDLWAVNLVASILSAGKNQSQLNCVVGRWSINDGLLSPDAFVIDTSKIRICGEGEVNLKESEIDIKVTPRAKKKEFFSLATPLKVQGSFEDINIRLGKGGLVGTVVTFITSPITTPIGRIFSDKIPADGSDICNMDLGAAERLEIVVPLCSK